MKSKKPLAISIGAFVGSLVSINAGGYTFAGHLSGDVHAWSDYTSEILATPCMFPNYYDFTGYALAVDITYGYEYNSGDNYFLCGDSGDSGIYTYGQVGFALLNPSYACAALISTVGYDQVVEARAPWHHLVPRPCFGAYMPE